MTKLKIVGIYGHNGYMRQLAATKHDWTFVRFDDRKYEHGYQDIFDDRKKNNWNIINTNDFYDRIKEFDLLLLDREWAMNRFDYMKIPKAYAWIVIRDLSPLAKKFVGNKPLMIHTSNNQELRPIDRVVSMGVNPEDFPKRDVDEIEHEKFLFPVNNYMLAGERDTFCGEIVGYDWRNLIFEPEAPISMCGKNMEWDQKHRVNTMIGRKKYQEWLRTYASMFQPSTHKHHSNVMAEAMMSGQAIVTRPLVPYKVNPSPLIDNWNAKIVTSQKAFIRLYKSGFLKDKKTLSQLGENAYQTAMDTFHIKRVVEKWEEFFEHSLNFT